jgi:RNA polymerase sigma factor (sigma-70 family)
MANHQLQQVIHKLHRATLPPSEAALTDGQLLEHYIVSREESAFAALVCRHGPMVWGVCRRVLDSHQDAEDAFQATFLVLVRRAASVMPRDMVANWLYGVAHQTALKARATTARRRGREKQVTAMPEPALKQQELWHDLQPLLDQELSRLPDKYRAVIVLCDLEGKTRKEAAEHFHLAEGTVASRLATARAMLAKRLTRQGVPVTGAALGALLSHGLASANVPGAVATATIHAASMFAAGHTACAGVLSVKAVTLAEGVLKAMLLAKLKIATAVVAAVLVLGASAAAFAQYRLGTQAAPAAPQQQPQLAQKQPAPPPKKEPAIRPIKEHRDEEIIPLAVAGFAKTINLDSNTLIVADNGGENTVTLAKDASIEIDGKPGQLAALPAGTYVTVRQFIDARTARQLQANGPQYSGTIKSVDPEKRTITVEIANEEKTFVVATDANISSDSIVCPLSPIKLPAGAMIQLGLRVDQNTVQTISAAGPAVNGTVKAVDLAKSTITVNDRTYPVAADANIGIDWKPGKLAGLPPGCNVSMALRVDGKTVGRIQANGPSDFGRVKAVDVEKKTITVSGNPENRTYLVLPETVIRIDDKPGTLADIAVGSRLHALNARVDGKTADSINAYGPEYHHVAVGSVDPAKNTIHFDDTAPKDLAGKTFAVARDTQIKVDGKRGKLADVPAGAFVNFQLSVDRQTARVCDFEGSALGGCGGSEVATVSPGTNTITFAEKGSPDVAGKTFTVASNAWIQVNGKAARLAEVPVGACLNVTLTVDRQTVRTICAIGRRVNGILTSLDGKSNINIADHGTFTLARDVWVQIDGKNGCTLGQLQPGMTVTLYLHADQKTAGGIVAARR